ncbi:MAG: hypothetical protein PVF96_04745 [Candidatus Bathyarchaeota archaeon]|jgi:hypothetical protein
MGIFSVIEEYIKQRDTFLQNLAEGKNLKNYFISSTLTILVFSAIYGATMGFYSSNLQILFSAIKVPILLLVSLYITIPSYYVLYSLLGGKRNLDQTVILLLSSITIMSIVLLAMVPVNFFFIITTARSATTYAFTVLLNVTVFTIGGFFALIHFIKGAQTLYTDQNENWKPAFLLGSVILMFIGTQLAWVLRPYFNYYPKFIRTLESNFYTAMIDLIIGSTGRYAGAVIAGGTIIFGLLILYLFLSVLRGNHNKVSARIKMKNTIEDEIVREAMADSEKTETKP